MESLFQYFYILYGIYWFCLLVGLIIVRSGTQIGNKLEKFTWNSRIRLWHKQPIYEHLFSYMENKKYLCTSSLVMLLNLPMVIFQLVTGLILLSPIVAAYAGTLVGLIVGQGGKKAFFVYAIATLIFEFGAFASAGAIGMTIGESWLLSEITFLDSFRFITQQIPVYLLLPIGCLILNGLIEAMGPIFGVDGVPGMKAYRERILK